MSYSSATGVLACDKPQNSHNEQQNSLVSKGAHNRVLGSLYNRQNLHLFRIHQFQLSN